MNRINGRRGDFNFLRFLISNHKGGALCFEMKISFFLKCYILIDVILAEKYAVIVSYKKNKLSIF
jgi:hypothetical protein